MKQTKIPIKLSREEKLKLIKRLARQTVGLPQTGKKINPKKGGKYQRARQNIKLLDD